MDVLKNHIKELHVLQCDHNKKWVFKKLGFVCLFVCLFLILPLWDFSVKASPFYF